MQEISLSVRYFTEFLLKRGSIDSRFSGLDRGAVGSRIHRDLQKKAGRQYKAEVSLSLVEEVGDFRYKISGRADGVMETSDGIVVDEIKTTAQPLEEVEEESFPAHWAQGCVYAHILCVNRGLASAAVQLRYCNIDTLEVKTFIRDYSAEELREFVRGLLQQYERWARLSSEWRAKRNRSLQKMVFPFEEYRAGQRDMAIACYNTCKEGGRLFCCAPTGTGKTVSSLFPAMKAVGEGFGERIFYLTAKTITRKTAEETLCLLNQKKPLFFRSITLTAKDKICFLEERACLPEVCPWANGYYDRINDALYEILSQQKVFSREEIEKAARAYKLCPYELSLDIAQWCDAVVCDYNYLFDPVVRLQRFFEGHGGEFLFLVDEAHNLVDRSREMYSARLYKTGFFSFKKLLPKNHTKLHKALGQVNSAFVALRKQCEAQGQRVITFENMPQELEKPLAGFATAAEEFLEKNRGSELEKELLALYFEVVFYQRIAQGYDENYITLVYHTGRDTIIKLFCLDASSFLDNSMDLGRAAILFSATLEPLPYYRETLGGQEKAKLLRLQSPFETQNMGLFVAADVNTKYAYREQTLPQVAGLIYEMVSAKKGNYIAYFPSYSYMQQVLECFEESFPHIATIVQQNNMDEQAREDFLNRFERQPTQTMLGFCVLGGIFGEGIDLAGERLIGTAIVGVGLPQIGPEPDALRSHYNHKNGHGFEFAYQFPGMNKVLQAAGRVIRTATDKGVVLLIDSRFATTRYTTLFPEHWRHFKAVERTTLKQELYNFWQDKN